MCISLHVYSPTVSSFVMIINLLSESLLHSAFGRYGHKSVWFSWWKNIKCQGYTQCWPKRNIFEAWWILLIVSYYCCFSYAYLNLNLTMEPFETLLFFLFFLLFIDPYYYSIYLSHLFCLLIFYFLIPHIKFCIIMEGLLVDYSFSTLCFLNLYALSHNMSAGTHLIEVAAIGYFFSPVGFPYP